MEFDIYLSILSYDYLPSLSSKCIYVDLEFNVGIYLGISAYSALCCG